MPSNHRSKPSHPGVRFPLITRPLRIFLFCLGSATLSNPSHAAERIADVFADPAVDLNRPQGRAQAVARIKVLEDARAAGTRAKAKALRLPMRTVKADGSTREIIDFEGDKPIYLTTLNANAAISTAANLVQASPYSLDGTGLIVGVWDNGAVRATHQEFAAGNRVTVMDGATLQVHATPVAGTLGARGVSATHKGMASNVLIHSYDWTSDTSEMTSRAATSPNQFGTHIYLSNHSYGIIDGWDGNVWTGSGTDQNAVDPDFGRYDSAANLLDGLMYNAPYYIAFWSAGNDGDDNRASGSNVVIGGSTVAYNPAIHPPGDGNFRNGFETISHYGTAKNLITVGAANDAVTSGLRDPALSTLTNFSSTGPTDDGRIKPDLVANGTTLATTGSSGDSVYTTIGGTSISSPNAAGSAALVIDQYKRSFNSAMRASTLKGLLIHTATDIGNPGPDYKYGWGLVDTKGAVDHIIDHKANPGKSRMIEDQVSNTSTIRSYSFQWDGSSALRATLCWTDPAGAITSINDQDSRTSRLVNNLNLKLIAPNGSEYFPFRMPFVGTWTVASMNQNATTGVNDTDNVEQVLIQTPGQPGNWQVVVSYTGALSNGSQAYGLHLSGAANIPNLVNLISPNGGEVFYLESSYNITWGANVTGNVSIELLKGGAPHSVLAANEVNDGLFAWVVPSSLPVANDYAIRISGAANPAYTDTSTLPFSIVANPLAVALDTPGIVWSTSGNAHWFAQSSTTHDGIDAAQSGLIGRPQSSTLEATITGPGTLSFWWKVSSYPVTDYLSFSLNGIEQTGDLGRISGEVDWVKKSVNIPAGSNNIRWRYSQSSLYFIPSDAGWVDQVVFTPPPTYTVSFDANGGNSPSPTNKVVTYNGTYGDLASVTREGYSFTGWFSAISGGSPVTSSTTVAISANQTLYARWNTLPQVIAGANQNVAISTVLWTPEEIPTIAWYDAADANSITTLSNAVSQWNDKSGNNRHATQGVPAQRPAYLASDPMVNNKPSIGNLDPTGKIGLDTPSITAKNVYVVTYYKDGFDSLFDVFSTLFSSSDTANFGQYRVMGRVNTSDLIDTYHFNDLATYKNGSTLSSLSVLPCGASVFTFKSSAARTQIFSMGYNKAITDRNWQGYSSEWIFTDGAEDTASQQQIEGYLAHKWDLSANLPTVHPHKSAAPTKPAVTVTLNGMTTDAESDPLTKLWTLVNGPAPVVFASNSSAQTTATFRQEGTYTLRLDANDGWGSSGDDCVIIVGASGPGTVDHFVISGVPLQTVVGAAITGLTITAKDEADETASSFTGYVSFGGTAGITGNSANFVSGVLSDVTITPMTVGTSLSFTVNDDAGHTGSIMLDIQSLYSEWVRGSYARAFNDTALTSNPDGDGLNNLLEFAWDMDPTSAVHSSLSYAAGGAVLETGIPILVNMGTAQAPIYHAVFARRKDYQLAGLSYIVQFSADLNSWTASETTPQRLTGENSDLLEVVSVPYPATVPVFGGGSALPPRFFRLEVSSR